MLGWSLLTVPKMFGGNITNQSLISENDMLNHGQVLLTCPSADVTPEYQSCTSCWFFSLKTARTDLLHSPHGTSLYQTLHYMQAFFIVWRTRTLMQQMFRPTTPVFQGIHQPINQLLMLLPSWMLKFLCLMIIQIMTSWKLKFN